MFTQEDHGVGVSSKVCLKAWTDLRLTQLPNYMATWKSGNFEKM